MARQVIGPGPRPRVPLSSAAVVARRGAVRPPAPLAARPRSTVNSLSANPGDDPTSLTDSDSLSESVTVTGSAGQADSTVIRLRPGGAHRAPRTVGFDGSLMIIMNLKKSRSDHRASPAQCRRGRTAPPCRVPGGDHRACPSPPGAARIPSS
eukprot:763961-Hanusia_phi.AAC.3